MRALAATALTFSFLFGATAAQAKPTTVKVMTRNLNLGADLGPGLRATSLQELVDGAGVILDEVDANDFRIRAKGLSAEILKAAPDLVGLQEAALWRTQPCDKSPIPPTAATVRYDFLALLLAQLNKGKQRYRAVVTKPEFDFEVWANTDGNQTTAGPGCPMGSEINGRLTMRDVILARVGVVKTAKPRSGTFDTLLQVKPAGVSVDVTRGWTSVDATKAGTRFRFVNAHLEAFDNSASNHTTKNTDVGNGEIREAQAKELVRLARSGYSAKLPVIMLGDFNSDIATEVKVGDARAFRVIRDAGFVSRVKSRPFACCLKGGTLRAPGGSSLADLDHTVDHITTDTPKRVTLVSSHVTGRAPVNGFWNSDHMGVLSVLRVR